MADHYEFPKEFLWGTATAAHQVEGNNVNSDFWVLEHIPGTIISEPSGDACDHYRRYREDIRLLAELGFKSYRFSIEWARVEPEDGMFSPALITWARSLRQMGSDVTNANQLILHVTQSASSTGQVPPQKRQYPAQLAAPACQESMARRPLDHHLQATKRRLLMRIL